ncbi:hypothetical protein [Nocardioides ferulae]|uniref:hypothetical protein n=1 Tax=Nocardioides ferulae TaxID=2340821 RepID=UPI000EB35037|nr:hypothetical protein [Nocardioides ferulae]
MDLTEDAFRALAQSSPWRWRSLHFAHRSRWGRVEAWVRRPGLMRVRDSGGREHRVDEQERRDRGRVYFFVSDDPGFVPPAPPEPRWPHEVEPVWRDDGLVGVRPDSNSSPVEYDDPMWQSYDWVAMLDPVELSHHTGVSGLREEERAGRRTWWARMTAQEGYQPRCGCCALLWSWFSDRDEYADEDDDSWVPAPGTVYPDAYDVALDVQTGVVVELRPIGGKREDLGFSVEILEVDADLSELVPD